MAVVYSAGGNQGGSKRQLAMQCNAAAAFLSASVRRSKSLLEHGVGRDGGQGGPPFVLLEGKAGPIQAH